ncbi:unnamed protein product [Ilex paraguariensis]|uniref:Uncharacterized protein n=1 Tax=Ilex paraguariensis TaxID=185542 RepID=A0ABC8SZD4_9AQUA
MADSQAKNNEARSSTSSGEISVKFEKSVSSRSGGVMDNGEALRDGQLSNSNRDSSGTDGRNFSRINTLPPEILNSNEEEPPSSQIKLERAKTESHRPKHILAQEAAQIFDHKIPVQEKSEAPHNVSMGLCAS